MKFNNSIFIIALAIIVSSCSSGAKVVKASQPQEYTLNLALADNPQADKYANLEYGIRLNIQDNRSDKRLVQVYDAAATSKPIVNAYPEVVSVENKRIHNASLESQPLPHRVTFKPKCPDKSNAGKRAFSVF